MKRCFGILMSLLILLVTMQQGIIFIHFKLNQEYIEANYCVNKSKPELNCHGKCQLEKEIQETTGDNELQFFSIYQEVKLMNTEFFTFFVSPKKSFNQQKAKIFNKPNHYHFSVYSQNIKPPILFDLIIYSR